MILIKNGKILTMAGTTYDPGSLLIKDGKINKIEREIETDPNELTEIIDATDCWVIPGLIESHCHIGITEEKKGLEGDDCNEMKDPMTPYIRGLDAINPMDSAFHNAISSGITSMMIGPGSSNVVGGQFVFIKADGRCIDDMVVMEPAAMKVAFGENPKGNYKELGMIPTTRMTMAAMLREELFNAREYLKNKENAEKNGEKFEVDFKAECWVPVLKKMIPLKAHVHRADDILAAIRIAKEFDVDLTLDHCTEGHLIANEIKESGFPAIIGPTLASRNKIEIQNMDFKTAGILHKHGVKVAICTDHPVSRIQYLPICAGFAAKEGLGIEEGLKAITINAAEICRVSHRVGSLEVGKDADIAVFTGNPMETFTKTLFTIINGEVIYRAEENSISNEKRQNSQMRDQD
jgi:imidazolonepropionase-like amidohydrolase